MMGHKQVVIPVEIYPADWCIWCDDPAHGDISECNILTMRQDGAGHIVVGPCGCTDNLVMGKQGDYIIRVTKVEKE